MYTASAIIFYLSLGFIMQSLHAFPPAPPIFIPPPIIKNAIPFRIKGPLSVESLFPKDGFFNDMNPIARSAVSKLTEYFLSKPDAKNVLELAQRLRNNTEVHPKLLYWALSTARYARPDLMELLPLSENFPFQMFPEMFVNLDGADSQNGSQQCQKTDGSLGVDNGGENKLWYFREDMFLNSHHYFWHKAFPTIELLERWTESKEKPGFLEKLPQPRHDSTIGRMADRRGELWYFMHAGIISRYRVERLLNGMPDLEVLNMGDENVNVIPEGYKSHLTDSNSGKKWVDRPANAKMQDVTLVTLPGAIRGGPSVCQVVEEVCLNVTKMREIAGRLNSAVVAGEFKDKSGNVISLRNENGAETLTNLLEASSSSLNYDYFGLFGLHGMGHFLFANIMNPTPDLTTPVGVIGDTATTMRDPLFYKWHGFIDEYFDKLKTIQLDSYSLDKLKWAGVKVDTVTISTNGIKETNLLHTFWNNAQFELSLTGINVNSAQSPGAGINSPPRKTKVCAKHLDHKDFSYQIQISKSGIGTDTATVRIFLAPKNGRKGERLTLEEQRRMFLPLDRFTVKLFPGKNNITRRSDESALSIPWTKQLKEINNPENLNPDQEAGKGFSYCGCGWPHHLLLPKPVDTADFDLVVIVTNGMEDEVEDDSVTASTCRTAEIYCGVPGRKYPDSKAMGYPFDKRWFNVGPNSNQELKTIEQYEEFVPNLSTKKVTIKHNDEEPA